MIDLKEKQYNLEEETTNIYINDEKHPKMAALLKNFLTNWVSDIYWDTDRYGFFAIISGKDWNWYLRAYLFDTEKIKAQEQHFVDKEAKSALIEKEFYEKIAFFSNLKLQYKNILLEYKKNKTEEWEKVVLAQKEKLLAKEAELLKLKEEYDKTHINDSDIERKLYLENVKYLRNYMCYMQQENQNNANDFAKWKINEYSQNKVIVIDNETQLMELFHIMFPFFYSEEPKSDGALYIEAIGNTSVKTNNRINITKKKELLLMDKIEAITDEDWNVISYKKIEGEKHQFLCSSDIAVFRPIYKIREIGEIKKRTVSLEYISIRLSRLVLSIFQKEILDSTETREHTYSKTISFINMLKHLWLSIENESMFAYLNEKSTIKPNDLNDSFTFFAEKSIARDNLEIFFEWLNLGEGLILISWPTGSWKTTLMYSLLNKYINDYEKTVVTIEDPIEYYLHSNKSIIIQREIGKTVASYSKWLIDALRQRPNIIVLGEIRDKETSYQLSNAIASWHLCLGTVHSASIDETITRVNNLLTDFGTVTMKFSYIINLRNLPLINGEWWTIYEHYLFDNSKDLNENSTDIKEMNNVFLNINKKLIFLYILWLINLNQVLSSCSDQSKMMDDLDNLIGTSYFKENFGDDYYRIDNMNKSKK